MTRARPRPWWVLPICLIACKRGGAEPPTNSPGDPADEVATSEARAEASGETAPIIAVRQRVIPSDPMEWSFSPDARLVASHIEAEDGEDGCGVWDIESGTFVREYLYAYDDEDDLLPCAAWRGDPRSYQETSPDGQLRASLSDELELETVASGASKTLACASCGVDAMLVWAPSGHQLATCNGEHLEIWDADTGKRVRTEALGLQDIEDVLIGWTTDGLGVAVRHRILGDCDEFDPTGMYCDYYDEDEDEGDRTIEAFALSSFWWPADGGKVIARPEIHTALDDIELYVDEGLRWLAFVEEHDYERDGYSITLHVLGTGARTSALGWTEYDDEGAWVEPWDGRWRVDAVTQWIEGFSAGDGGDFYDYGALELGWTAIVAEPTPGVFRGVVTAVEGGGVEGEIEVIAAAGGGAVARWEACVEENDTCNSGGPPVGNCDLLDVSPPLSLALVDCEGELRLIEATGRGSTLAKLRYDPDVDWRWGRANYLALLEGGGKLAVVDLATAKTLYERDDVMDLLEVPLAAEQDRLALAYVDHLEIVAGPTGERIVDIPGDWASAALSPDGEHIAVLGQRKVRIIDIATQATIATVEVGDAFKVAWRQDGAALFYGYDWPTHAVDPKTGEVLGELDHPVLDELELEELDPSWRWIHRPDGSVIRTLDFQRIELGPTWARIESGMFEGEIGALPGDLRFRIGDDPDAPPIHTVEELEQWLRSPGLAAAFFGGEPLPSPRAPVGVKAK